MRNVLGATGERWGDYCKGQGRAVSHRVTQRTVQTVGTGHSS